MTATQNDALLKEDDPNLLYKYGKSADYFVMILEGKVRVTVGNESLTYESGPFTYFGVSAMKPPALASKILLGGSLIGNSSNIALNNLPSASQLRKQSLIAGTSSRPPSPDASLAALENQPLTIAPCSNPSSPEILSLIRSPSGNSEMLSGARTGSVSQLLQQTETAAHSFIPDFTVKPIENTLYMKISRKVYLAAFRASLMDRKDEFLEGDFTLFKEEIDNIICSSLAAQNKVIGANNQTAASQISKNMKKSSSDVLKDKKFSIGTSSSPKKSQESASINPQKPLKRRSSIIESIGKTFSSSPQSPSKSSKKFIKHQQSVPSATSNQPSQSSANNSSSNYVNNLTNQYNIIPNPAQLDTVIIQKEGKY